MLPQSRFVQCRGLGVDDSGTALLLAGGGEHLLISADALHVPSDAVLDQLRSCSTVVRLPETANGKLKWIGGQELRWDLHMPVPGSLRSMDLAAILETLFDYDAFQRGGHDRLKTRP